MKANKILALGIGFSLLAVVFGFLTSTRAPAQVQPSSAVMRHAPPPIPTVPVMVTNTPLQALRASDTVTLIAGNMLGGIGPCVLPGYYPFEFSVNKAEGFYSSFTLPPGRVLVVTSFDWTASGSSTAASVARTVSLFPAMLQGPEGGGLNVPEAQSTALADLNGKAGGSETFPSGIVLKNPGTLCFKADPPPGAGESVQAILNGFLATDQ